MELTGSPGRGPDIEDPELLAELPRELRGVLSAVKGFVLFGGALHGRRAVREPTWHSLRAHCTGADALAALLEPDDVPFAQECVGGQLLPRGGAVVRLAAETGEVEPLGMRLLEFLEPGLRPSGRFSERASAHAAPERGRRAAARMLLHAYPPFCTEQARRGVSLRPVPAAELIRVHAEFARHIPPVPEGASIQVRVTDG